MGAKTLKLKFRNHSNFTITFPTIWKCAGDIFKVLLKFKRPPRTIFNFLVGAKTQKISLDNFFEYFNITFLATCGCAIDFYPSARWARTGIVVPFVRSRLRRCTHSFGYYTNMAQQIKFIIHTNIQPLPALFLSKVIGQRSRSKIYKNCC